MVILKLIFGDFEFWWVEVCGEILILKASLIVLSVLRCVLEMWVGTCQDVKKCRKDEYFEIGCHNLSGLSF